MTPPDSIDQRISIHGETIFLRRWHVGDGDAAPIVLLHDSLGSVAQWRDFPAHLAQATARDVIAYDRRGFGESDPRPHPATIDFIDEEATQVFPALREALSLDRFVLFGHSIGGGMALAIAAHQPDACEAVITESAQAFVEERTLAGIRAAKQAFADPAQLQRLTRWHGEKAAWVLAAWTEVWLSPAFRDWSVDSWLPKIRCPVLAIHGDHDEFGSPAFPRHIVAGVAMPAEMVLLADCGHVPHREHESLVLELTRDFLAGAGADQDG